MKVEQLSIMVENRPGKLAEILRALSAAGINIYAISLADTSDFGILRLIASRQTQAKQILLSQGIAVGSANVLAVVLPDAPGSLETLLQTVSSEGINLEYMYNFRFSGEDKFAMIMRFDKMEAAIAILSRHQYELLDNASLEAHVR